MPNDSILQTIKKLLGISPEYTQFDQDIIVHINSVFNILSQLGVGPEDGFSINDEMSIWSDYLGEAKSLELVKSYIYLKVKLLFDPPMTSSVADSINRLISELEWRINVTADTDITNEESKEG